MEDKDGELPRTLIVGCTGHILLTYAGSVNRDHVHIVDRNSTILIGIKGRAVQYLKDKSLHKLLSENSYLRKRYWGQDL